jgi:hypothetical protein
MAMKIRVEREDGRVETLFLKGRWHVVEGKYQNRLSDESGIDYFFTHDGHYDGWGGAVCCDEQTAHEMTALMEQKREIE